MNDNSREDVYNIRDNMFEYYIGVLDEYANSDNDTIDYWQGRKDASRAMLAIISTSLGEMGDVRAYNLMAETSSDARLSKTEAMQKVLSSAIPLVAMAVMRDAEGRLMSPSTRDGLYQFVCHYDKLAKEGVVKKINHALVKQQNEVM